MKALILVDLQYDFLPGGALAVSEGDQTIAVANRIMPMFDWVVATQDWHPADHLSFASQHEGKALGDTVQLAGLEQVLWPDHCIWGTHGAELHEALNQQRINHYIRKGTSREIDSYSGFFDNGHRQATGLHRWLQANDVTQLAVMGLATDYCVKHTVLDALQLGFSTTLLIDGCRGVQLEPGDIERAVGQMRQAGASIMDSQQWPGVAKIRC